MKKLLLIHTGGTISMIEDKVTGAVNHNGGHPLLDLANTLHIDAHIEEEVIFDLPSPHITPEHMLILAQNIEQKLNQYDGFVVTHGTDTLEETIYFLDLYLQTDKPVVLTGAMRSSNELGTDAMLNLKNALLVALEPESYKKGVLAVMDGHIHLAQEVTKTSSINLDAFKSTNGFIGEVIGDVVTYIRKFTKESHSFSCDKMTKKVYLLKAYAGIDEDFIQAILNLQPDGLVIEAFGQGNLPNALIPILKQFLIQDIPIVITSRSYHSIVRPTYGYHGGGKHLEELGLILTSQLSGQKARMKLLLALQSGYYKSQLKHIF